MLNRSPRLHRSQIETLLFMRSCEKNIFSQVPDELLLKICGYDLQANRQDYELALNYIVNAEFQGCDLHVMSEIPKDILNYKNSYILLRSELKYIKDDTAVETVTINDVEKLLRSLKTINKSNAKRIHLSDEQVKSLITSNGGHTPLESLKTLLETKPFLVLFKGLPKKPLITPAGLVIEDENITLLECALGAGDPEIVEMIKPYFLQFQGGKEKMEHQLQRYRPCIDAIMTQKPYDLTGLFNILINSHPDDVAAELKTGEDYDWDYCSPLRIGSYHKGSDLRDALNQFREDFKPGILTAPRMHCNYQNLQHAFDMLKDKWNNLRVGNNYDKIDLAWQQIIGIIELQGLPGYERKAFARDRVEEIGEGQSLDDRSTEYKYGVGRFPCNDGSSVDTHSGFGFDFAADIYGGGRDFATLFTGSWDWGVASDTFSKFMSSKSFKLAELVLPLRTQFQNRS
jgi:hypothetical protein